ncbi:MAG: hypothetical protein R3C01_16110 [Planctomycetaceae bacterium]
MSVHRSPLIPTFSPVLTRPEVGSSTTGGKERRVGYASAISVPSGIARPLRRESRLHPLLPLAISGVGGHHPSDGADDKAAR